jgi:hypothetical protein
MSFPFNVNFVVGTKTIKEDATMPELKLTKSNIDKLPLTTGVRIV